MVDTSGFHWDPLRENYFFLIKWIPQALICDVAFFTYLCFLIIHCGLSITRPGKYYLLLFCGHLLLTSVAEDTTFCFFTFHLLHSSNALNFQFAYPDLLKIYFILNYIYVHVYVSLCVLNYIYVRVYVSLCVCVCRYRYMHTRNCRV